MKNLIIRDALATVITAAVVAAFVGYSVLGSIPFVQDPRGMSGVGLVGAVLLALVFGPAAFRAARTGPILAVLGILTLGVGVAALIMETNWTLLVPLVAGVVALWLVGVARDAGALTRPPALRHG